MATVPGHDHPISAFYISAILLIMTSQGWQNSHQKSRPVHIGVEIV